jgi:hypothetical protein
MKFIHRFFDAQIERDGRVSPYSEHLWSMFACVVLAFFVLELLLWAVGFGPLLFMFFFSALFSIGSYAADKRLNGSTDATD